MDRLSLDHWVTLICSALVLSVFAVFAVFLFPFRELSEETKKRPRSFISNALFREYWYFIMNPLKKRLIEWEVQPNTITSWGFLFSVLAGLAFCFGKFGIGGWLVILSSTCDVYDGMLARYRQISLRSGAFYDSTLDRVGELAMMFGLLWYFHDDFAWFTVVFLGLASSQIVSYVRARAEGLGFNGWKGFFQRAERMIILSIGMGATPMLDLIGGAAARDGMVKVTVAALCLGSVQTALSRSWAIFHEIKANETKA